MDLFSKDIDLIKDELNAKRWLPFVSKAKVLRLVGMLANRWVATYRQKRHEDSQKVLDRLKELDTLYEEREKQREEELRKRLEVQKKALVDSSAMAFCHGVCKERAGYSGGVLCSCNRRNRYVRALEEQFNAYMAENAERLINEFKETPKWRKPEEEN